MTEQRSQQQPTNDQGPEAARLRREAVEIVQRHRRGLPGRHVTGSPPPVVAQEEAARAALAEGRTLLAAGRVAEALLRADAAVGFSPPGSLLLADSWSLRGEGCLVQANLQSARAAFKRALAINPAHVPARIGLADSFQRAHQPERAIPLYVETIPLLPDPAERARLRLLLADCYLAAGRPDAAQRVLRTVESAGKLSWAERLRALLTFFLPTSPVGAILLLLAALSVGSTALGASTVPALAAGLLSLVTFFAFQWWRLDVR